ncbi:hypothetical protein [Phenylobacterium sp.]|jgi:hypothetical protein|uniref:hypothetical protein n=1 Tax=Phenylobacterium sp. TaxID=1871053 RepID=UPI002E31C704|nr:hypothetical protein [Phenylobacterium sp.]HEX2562183.1 hypothetical protein [Phenylobacterium sp.]
MRRVILALAVLCLAGVRRSAPARPARQPAGRSHADLGGPVPADQPAGSGVVERCFAEVAEGDYAAAWRLWADGPGRPADADALARSLAAYDSYNALIGAPGAAEGAAGSLYVRSPLQVYARLKDGREVHRLGTATLRRGPGAFTR